MSNYHDLGYNDVCSLANQNVIEVSVLVFVLASSIAIAVLYF